MYAENVSCGCDKILLLAPPKVTWELRALVLSSSSSSSSSTKHSDIPQTCFFFLSITSGPKLTLPVDADEEQVVDGDDAQGQHEGISQATQLWANEKPQFQKEAHGAGHEAHQQVRDGEAADDQVGGAA